MVINLYFTMQVFYLDNTAVLWNVIASIKLIKNILMALLHTMVSMVAVAEHSHQTKVLLQQKLLLYVAWHILLLNIC